MFYEIKVPLHFLVQVGFACPYIYILVPSFLLDWIIDDGDWMNKTIVMSFQYM